MDVVRDITRLAEDIPHFVRDIPGFMEGIMEIVEGVIHFAADTPVNAEDVMPDAGDIPSSARDIRDEARDITGFVAGIMHVMEDIISFAEDVRDFVPEWLRIEWGIVVSPDAGVVVKCHCSDQRVLDGKQPDEVTQVLPSLPAQRGESRSEGKMNASSPHPSPPLGEAREKSDGSRPNNKNRNQRQSRGEL